MPTVGFLTIMAVDFNEYKQLYNQLLSQKGREEIGDDTERTKALEKKIDTFLETYKVATPKDKDPKTPWVELSAKEIFHRSINTAIDVVNDVSQIVSQKESMSNADFRRSLFRVFTAPKRRIYVGLWLIFLSFLLYFIDSSA